MKELFLTFDDGPHRGSTEKVLDLLDRHGTRATFFVIAEKAKSERELLKRVVSSGHAIGNHSLDHGYSRFFRGKTALKDWITSAEECLREMTGAPTVGFRPPAGVRTPELYAALRELEMPLVLWKRRFFDTTFALKRERLLRSLKKTRSGDIILLHDRQSPKKLPVFLDALEAYLPAAKAAGFGFKKLGIS